MAPKTNNTPKTNKKKRKVLNIAQKLEIVNLLENGEKVAAVARKFEVNESTIRTIRDNSDKIKTSASHLGPNAVLCKVTGNFQFWIV